MSTHANEASQWIRCSERMPSSYCDVLVPFNGRVVQGWQEGGIWHVYPAVDGESVTTAAVSHWLFLPELPEEA